MFNYPLHLSMVLNNGKVVSYISKAEYANLDGLWTSNLEDSFYKLEQDELPEYESLKRPDLDNIKLFEAKVSTIPYDSMSNDLARLMIANLSDAPDFLSKIKDQEFSVSYYDKYNQSEFSLRLLLKFVQEFQKEASLTIKNLKIHLERGAFDNNRYPIEIRHNYQNILDYKHDLNELSKSLSFNIISEEEQRLPHYRYFDFKSKEVSFHIRIDGGIAHGFKPKEYLRSDEMTYDNNPFEIKKYVKHDIIYNISLENGLDNKHY